MGQMIYSLKEELQAEVDKMKRFRRLFESDWTKSDQKLYDKTMDQLCDVKRMERRVSNV